MKTTINLFLIILGVLLISSGIFFKLRDWPDSFYGIYTGILFFLLGIFLSMKKKKRLAITYLSSNLTFIFKFLIPLFSFLILVFFVIGALFFFPKEHIEFYKAFSIFLFVIFICNSFLLYIQEISYDDNVIYVNNFFNRRTIYFNQNIKIERFLFYFYKIKYIDKEINKSVLFIPKIHDVFVNFFKPKCIEDFKIKLRKYDGK